MKSFRIKVPESDLVDLRDRLLRTRLPEPTPGTEWAAGVPKSYLQNLVTYWEAEFDWRAQERWLNSFPQFTADIDSQLVHFVHVKSSHPHAVPLVLSHGWPYSFAEMLPLVTLLSDFDLVIPSLPGFVFSDAPTGFFTDTSTARTIHKLMTDVLGYARYGTYGEDIGASVSHSLASLFPDSVLGIFVTHPAVPQVDDRKDLSAAEDAFIAWLDAEWEDETAYAHLQSTRPDTVAAALNDSPAGLAAWILEKFRSWSDRRSGPTELTLDEKFSRDDLLRTISLYWFTQSIGSSFRSYYHLRHREKRGAVHVPTGIAVGTGDLGYPRELAQRTYTDIRSFAVLPHGGHFTAKEEPELISANIRAFFQGLLTEPDPTRPPDGARGVYSEVGEASEFESSRPSVTE
ncbi:epoxide hydrolase family protein [Cryobacterium sp. TMB1-7]|uniref:epoxide hydrolase family protein n=1 Tax=Cryobacterium sp. TMB1-7 TaxID=2555866 RepID=UPI001069467D|nr:epoxide hydrolase family protein [Cryobacterium sp. TMB1-7]TFC57479.1 epoxide hydrolase [Cryobacterium sp. TMB1-7]